MGYFNYTGCISNLPIYSGEDIVLFINMFDQKKAITNVLDCNYGFKHIFVPIAPPLYGQYDEQGGIEKVIEDKNAWFIRHSLIALDGFEDMVHYCRINYRFEESQKKCNEYRFHLGCQPDWEFCISMEHRKVYEAIVKAGKRYYDWDESFRISKRYRGMFDTDSLGYLKPDPEIPYGKMDIANEDFPDRHKNSEGHYRYEKLFNNDSVCINDEFHKTINVNPEYKEGVFCKCSDIWPDTFAFCYQQDPSYIWKNFKEGDEKPLLDFISFYRGLFDLQIDLGASRYAHQQKDDQNVMKLLNVYTDIIQNHITQQEENEKEIDEY